MDEEIKLSFVNEGKPFKMPRVTVLEQQNWLDDMAKMEKELKKKDKDGFDKDSFDREASRYFILHMLNLVDKKVGLKDIDNMHPSDYIYLSNLIWSSGRELGGEKTDFLTP